MQGLQGENPNLSGYVTPENDVTYQILYERKMIEIKYTDHIGSNYEYINGYDEKNKSIYIEGNKFNDEYFQCIRQNYDFTCIDHIYQKDNKKYIYNNKTLKFDVLNDTYNLKCDINKTTNNTSNYNENNKKQCILGENEKCKTCDLNHTELCETCNEGYYLPDKNKYKR